MICNLQVYYSVAAESQLICSGVLNKLLRAPCNLFITRPFPVHFGGVLTNIGLTVFATSDNRTFGELY